MKTFCTNSKRCKALAAFILIAPNVSANAQGVPADKFDLSEWNITLPSDDNNDSKPDTVSTKKLKKFEHPDFFYLDDEGYMVFTSPNKAQTTSGTTNTRSELRQMLRGGKTRVKTQSPMNSFTLASNPVKKKFASVGGKMEATLKVDHVAVRAKYPEKYPAFSVVIGQIHATKWDKKVQGFGWGNEPLKIYYKKWPDHDKGSIFWTYELNLPQKDPNRKDIAYPVWGNTWENPDDPADNGIALGQEISYVVNVHGDIMYLTFEAEGRETVEYKINLANAADPYGKLNQSDHPYGYTLDWNYFKAGAYNQCSASDKAGFWYAGCSGTGNWEEDKANGDYTQVSFSRLVVTDSVEPRPDHGEKPQIGASLNKKESLNIEEIPANALVAIRGISPDFVAKEVEKEYKHDNVYLDVEGELSDGSEIEFDMLQVEDGWQVVEVQRDLIWEQLPETVSTALNTNSPNYSAKRIIESFQYGSEVTVYEFYAVNADGTESKKEVKLENGLAVVLDEEWQH